MAEKSCSLYIFVCVHRCISCLQADEAKEREIAGGFQRSV